MKIRINKYLSSIGLASRRKVDEWIEQGKILVNQKKAEAGIKIDPEKDEIQLNNHVVPHKKNYDFCYYMLYKPQQVVSTVKDPEKRKTVLSFIKTKTRIYPVGRLDFESEGLILLMNDGDLANRLTHPRFHVPKKYQVWITGELNKKKLERFRNGIMLSDGMTSKAEVEVEKIAENYYLLTVILKEGRKRQIRRMCSKLKLEVKRLKRIAMGSLELGEMKVGEIRELTQEEILKLKKPDHR